MSYKIKPLFQFASLAFMTQGVLLLNQIVLLPIQLSVWKTEETAYWYSILAIAAVTSISDFGLRIAGHHHLLRWTNNRDDKEAATEFTELWAWIRILFVLATAVLVVGDFAFHRFYLDEDYYPLWRTALLVGIALEGMLIVRTAYLDTLAFYNQAELGYLLLVAGRLILAVGALVLFHASPATLGWIWFWTGVAALTQQGFLCRRAGILRLFERLPANLPWRHVATIRYTMADPCSSWVRIQVPVIVLAAFAPAIAIVTYVALRAIFGAARTTILQISRYASVEYLALRHKRMYEMAEKQLTMLMLLSAFFGSGVAVFVLADNGRLASFLLRHMDMPIYQMMSMTFGLGNAFFAFQICVNVCRRSGEVAEVAHRQYFYVICAAIFAVIALVTKSMLVWLLLMAAADVLQALSFMLTPAAQSILRQTSSGWRTAMAATVSTASVLGIQGILYIQPPDFLVGHTVFDVLCTIAFFLSWVLVIGFVDISLTYGMQSGHWLGVPLELLHRLRGLNRLRAIPAK
jgi:hypothetical protein